MKALLVILDGMADRSQRVLGGKTPLQAALTPNLDSMAAAGACGHMYPIGPGICTTSDHAHWRILGYGDLPFPGRAAVEALAGGIRLERGDVVIRFNMATTAIEKGGRYVQVAPAFLPEEQAVSIAGSLSKYQPINFDVELHHEGGPFLIMVLRGGASAEVSDSDPLFYQMPVPPVVPFEGSPAAAAATADEIIRFTDWAVSVLLEHEVNAWRADEAMNPINYLLSKWPSTYADAPSFTDRWGFNGAIVASGVLYGGFAELFNMDFYKRKTTGDYEDLNIKIEAALELLEGEHDFVLVHTKAPDEAGHTGKPRKKVSTMEELDRALSPIIEKAMGDPGILTVITSDHPTPSGGSLEVMHSGESVPVVMAGENVRIDNVNSFDEVSCAGGSIGQITGDDVMPLILNFTDRAKFGTSRTSGRDTKYRT